MIVTACSKRKKSPIDPSLHAANLTAGSIADVACQWLSQVDSAPKPHRSTSLYGGRSFKDATWSAEAVGSPLVVISAGLGVVGPEQDIPAYALTTVGASDENVLSLCPKGSRPSDWWRTAFAGNPLPKLIGDAPRRVYLALPSAYLEMIYDDLAGLDMASIRKLRILTGSGEALSGSRLADQVMPYDARLDGPDSSMAGTKSDFASRALRHFISITQDRSGSTALEDRSRVDAALSSMRFPKLPKRERKSDEEIRAVLIEHWQDEGGNRQRLLRLLRDKLLYSCEQSRFARIARDLEAEGLV